MGCALSFASFSQQLPAERVLTTHLGDVGCLGALGRLLDLELDLLTFFKVAKARARDA